MAGFALDARAGKALKDYSDAIVASKQNASTAINTSNIRSQHVGTSDSVATRSQAHSVTFEWTAVKIDELHMLEPSENELYSDIQFLPKDYVSQLNENVKYNYMEEQNKIIFNISNNTYEMNTKDKFVKWTFKNISYGNIIEYDINNNILMTSGQEYFFEEIASPQIFSTVKATVNYNNEKFTLSDFKLDFNE